MRRKESLMGTLMVACISQLSSTKKGKLKLTGVEISGALPDAMSAGAMTPAGPGAVATRLPLTLKRLGAVKLLRRVYLPTAESLGRNAAHASSTRAAAPRRFSIDARALQLVCPARSPAWSAVTPPGCARVSSSGTGKGV